MTSEPVRYMERSRSYYQAQGFERAYVWAHHVDVPFERPRQPLSASTLGLITTAALYDRRATDQRAVDSAPTYPGPSRLYAGDLSWDKQATHLDDPGSYFPIDHLKAMVEEGRLGSLARRFYCAPTEYSQRRTNEVDAPGILRLCRQDQVDVALLVPL